MFSLALQVIGQSWECRKRSVLPIVYFNRQCLYWSEGGYHDARNVWEYYFEPVSASTIGDVADADMGRLERSSIWEFSRRDVEVSTPVPSDVRVGSIPVRAGSLVSDRFPYKTIDYTWEMSMHRKRALHAEIVDRVRVKSRLAEKIQAFVSTEMAGRNVLGVHVRGAERGRERVFLAPGGEVPFECYVREIDTYLAAHPRSLIFCATDSQAPLTELTRRYGARILSYKVSRLSPAEEGVGLHHLADAVGKARMGEEVVIECVLLSRCNFLLHGMSNVSLFATLINPSLPHLNVYHKYGFKLQRMLNNLGVPRAIGAPRTFWIVHKAQRLSNAVRCGRSRVAK